MKITREQFEQALIAGRVAVSAGLGARTRYENAIGAALASLGIEVDDSCQCSTTVREYCASNECHGGSRIADEADEMVWVARTWIDVRQGDIVRPVQPPSRQADETHAAIVVKLGPVNHWHASPNASQYRPNESPMEWSAIGVTLEPLGGDGTRAFTPEHGMKPDAGVEIKVTRAELAAIEACGGWTARLDVLESGA